MRRERIEVGTLVGKHLTKTVRNEDSLVFYCSDGSVYEMLHDQDCCESVYLEDFCGDIDDLCDADIHEFRVDTSDNVDHKDDDECQWTFYNIRTSKGYVTLRWYGSSNGYYSVDVDFYMITPPTDLFKSYYDNDELSPYESFDYKKGSRFPFGYNVIIIFKNGEETHYVELNQVVYNEASDSIVLVNKLNIMNTINTNLIKYIYISSKCPRVN